MEPEVEKAARQLLQSVGKKQAPSFSSMGKGGNNRLYRVDCGAERFVLKVYFQHPTDLRNRLHSEYAFISFAWDHGIRRIPRPIARHDSPPMGLYEFLEGEEPRDEEIDRNLVSQAWALFFSINQHRNSERARELPLASEACFCLEAHLDLVRRRLTRLGGIQAGHAGPAAMAVLFVQERLRPAWARIQEKALDLVASGSAAQVDVSPRDRFLCPADLGFHNAIRSPDGQTRFVDFEYAGWDDPVKFFCDFFLHPAVPVPREFMPEFLKKVAETMVDPLRFRTWTKALFDVHALKWCCIMLNEFLPGDEARRRFAMGTDDIENRQWKQLGKAEQALARIAEMG